MPGPYRAALRIAIYKGDPESMEISEESTFKDLTFAKMTKISSEFYDLMAKLVKEMK